MNATPRSPRCGSAFNETADILGTLFFIFISIVAGRRVSGCSMRSPRPVGDDDYFVPGAKKFKMARPRRAVPVGRDHFGILIINFGPVDGPTGTSNVLAFMSRFVMGADCLTLAGVNRMMLPRRSDRT